MDVLPYGPYGRTFYPTDFPSRGTSGRTRYAGFEFQTNNIIKRRAHKEHENGRNVFSETHDGPCTGSRLPATRQRRSNRNNLFYDNYHTNIMLYAHAHVHRIIIIFEHGIFTCVRRVWRTYTRLFFPGRRLFNAIFFVGTPSIGY